MWIELSVHTTGAGVDIVSELLMHFGAQGTQIIDKDDIPDSDKPHGNWELIDKELKESMPEDVIVKAWFEDGIPDMLDDELQNLLELSETDIGTLMVEVKGDIDGDWSKSWRRFYKPFRIGERIVVKPSWEEFDASDEDIVIEMDPGMAFGTGTHETSSLVLSLIERYQDNDDNVLDIGTGSGILAILSAKLGAKEVLGIDIDEMAVEVARENVERNGVGDAVSIRCGDLTKGITEKYGLVLANILAEVILILLPDLKKVLKEDGKAILSGILMEKGSMVEEALHENGFRILEKVDKGEWLAMVVGHA